jgi:hypothetical protein
VMPFPDLFKRVGGNTAPGGSVHYYLPLCGEDKNFSDESVEVRRALLRRVMAVFYVTTMLQQAGQEPFWRT